jgi:hypothetical protein
MPKDHEEFNTHLGKLRITSEHTIGMLKARFPFLRSIPMVINDHKTSMRKVLRVIDCCIILHNLLIDLVDDIPKHWYEEDDIIDDEDFNAELDELVSPINANCPNDTRRQRCMNLFKNLGIVE